MARKKTQPVQDTPTQPGFRLRKLADRSEGERSERLIVPASELTPLRRNDEGTWEVAPADDPDVAAFLVDPAEASTITHFNPATPKIEHEPWPPAGVVFEGEPPKKVSPSTNWVDQAQGEGFLELVGEEVVHRPGGPESNPWASTHTFRHAQALILHLADGDYRYRVVRNPDKQHPNREGDAGEVWWFYELELEA